MKQNLLDTHTLIWYLNGDTELSAKARKAIEAAETINYVSIVSLWEIAVKISLGKLQLKTPFSQIERQIEANGFELLPITVEDALQVATLPFHHRDPFDRMLIAQSISSALVLLSKDKNMSLYKARILW